jgi:putative methionine-R-sulfoxide reductase with GAF domain
MSDGEAEGAAVKQQRVLTPFYQELVAQVGGLVGDVTDWVTNCANVSSLVYHELAKVKGEGVVNWCGFYVRRRANPSTLLLGPFQGKPACLEIPIGKGVCGTAAQTATTHVVANVHEFPGHIACDAASQSEIVVPVIARSGATHVIGVFDLDSTTLNCFNDDDKAGLEQIVAELVKRTTFEFP